jgi:hypothetical protein
VKRLVLLGALFLFAVPASATTSRILAPMDWWPVWSPNAAYVAFTRVYPNQQQLKVLTLRTGKVTQIGTSASQLNPTWSQNGTQLAYSSGGVVYTVDANGTHKLRYLPAPAKSFAPAWRPRSSDLAYLTTKGATNTDLWVAGTLWARNVIGVPSWDATGDQIAFQRDDGIYVSTGPLKESRRVSVANPGPPVWSHDGGAIAYAANGQLYTTANPKPVARLPRGLRATGTPQWSYDDKYISVPTNQGGWVVQGAGGKKIGVSGPGIAWSPRTNFLIGTGPRKLCPGHAALQETGLGGGVVKTLTGSCLVVGTPKADVIEGTPLWGDVIVAGAGNDRVHANDGHTDRVNCGPGRDTVWADRTDRLTGCEIVHR